MDKFTELKIDVKTEGTGRAAQKGDTVAVHYTGRLTDGTVFDSSYDRGEPIEFPVGVGMVIPGWDQSLLRRASLDPVRSGLRPLRRRGRDSAPRRSDLRHRVGQGRLIQSTRTPRRASSVAVSATGSPMIPVKLPSMRETKIPAKPWMPYPPALSKGSPVAT